MNIDEALLAIGIDSYANLNELSKAYKLVSIRAHPDKGGSTELMQKVNQAYQYLKERYEPYNKPKNNNPDNFFSGWTPETHAWFKEMMEMTRDCFESEVAEYLSMMHDLSNSSVYERKIIKQLIITKMKNRREPKTEPAPQPKYEAPKQKPKKARKFENVYTSNLSSMFDI